MHFPFPGRFYATLVFVFPNSSEHLLISSDVICINEIRSQRTEIEKTLSLWCKRLDDYCAAYIYLKSRHLFRLYFPRIPHVGRCSDPQQVRSNFLPEGRHFGGRIILRDRGYHLAKQNE